MVAQNLFLPAPSGPDETAGGVDQRAEVDVLPQFLLGFPPRAIRGPLSEFEPTARQFRAIPAREELIAEQHPGLGDNPSSFHRTVQKKEVHPDIETLDVHLGPRRADGPQHFPLAGRSRPPFHSEARALHGPADGPFGTIGDQNAALPQQAKGLFEAFWGPEFRLAVGGKGVEVDDVEPLVSGAVPGELLPSRAQPGELTTARPFRRVPVGFRTRVDVLLRLASSDPRQAEVRALFGAQGKGLEGDIVQREPRSVILPAGEGEQGIESRAEPQLKDAQGGVRSALRREAVAGIEEDVVGFGARPVAAVVALAEPLRMQGHGPVGRGLGEALVGTGIRHGRKLG